MAQCYEILRTTTPKLLTRLSQASGTIPQAWVWEVRNNDGNPAEFSHQWEYDNPRPGWWGLTESSRRTVAQAGNQTANAADRGCWWEVRGAYRGLDNSDGVSTAAYHFYDHFAWEDRNIRGGQRKVGDVYRLPSAARLGGYAEKVVVTDGYEGPEWGVDSQYEAAVAPPNPIARPAHIVRPTVAYEIAKPGNAQKRFRCDVSGSSHVSTEPDWDSATIVGVDTVRDNDVTWRYIGNAPEIGDACEVRNPAAATVTQPRSFWSGGTSSDGTPLPKIDSVRDAKTTTNNTTSTASSVTIPANTAGKFDVTVTAMQDDGTDMAWFVLRGSWRRVGTAAPVQHRAPEVGSVGIRG